MAEIKPDTAHQQHLIVSEPDISDQKPSKPKRLASLDIFRGLTVSLMILVDDAGGEWPMIGHAPWNGCNLADFVMPFFLFIVGMSIALSLKGIPDQLLAVKKVILRTLKLLFWGLLLQGGFSHAPGKLTYGVDVTEIRWCGILQRIALAYLVVALIEIFLRCAQKKDVAPGRLSIFKLYYWQWLVAACVLTTYFAVIYGTYVPDWQFTVHDRDSSDYGKSFTVFCGARGKLDPPCNAVGYIDRQVLGINHMYQHPAWKRSKACTENSPYEGPFRNDAPSWCRAPFEPEGIVSSISAILSTIIGVHFGHVLVHMKVDIYDIKFMFLPLEWIGMNAMLVYVMAAEGIFAGFFNDILDPEAHFCWDLAFKESRHSALCPLCRDLVLGHCCWHFALVGHILEALNSTDMIYFSQ
ncbi:hypothetical protein ACLB2K_060865 [Fragaria x ananassa]